MRKYLTILLIGLSLTSSFAQGDTMYIEGRHLYTAQGEKVILRGMNIMSVWSDDKQGEWSMAEIAKTGSNCARLVWTEKYGNKQELVKLIDNCIANKMIAMPECHDATGDMSKLDICINFWNDSSLLEVMQRNKEWTLLNIGNEVGDHAVTAAAFEQEYKRAIDSIRGWGYTMPIVIDASSWGQSVDIIIETWEEITNQDPLRNVIFSVHSYWTDTDNYDKIAEKSLSDNIPIIIGEGPSITKVPECQLLDFEYGLKCCNENEIGWLSWSWGIISNGDCDAYFDHTTDGIFGNWETEYAKDLVVNNKHGLMQSAERPASMFEGSAVPVSGIYVYTEKEEYFIGDTVLLKAILTPANAVFDADKIDIEVVSGAENIEWSKGKAYFVANNVGDITIKAVLQETALSHSQIIKIVSN